MDITQEESPAWRGTLTLSDILAAAGVEDPSDVLILRHTFKEAELPSLEAATPEAVLRYTRRQLIAGGKFPAEPPALWLVFLADGKVRSRFFGSFRNLGEAPGERTERLRSFNLEPSPLLDQLAGRLVVDWTADAINWVKRGGAASSLKVVEIADRDAVPFPGFDSIHLTYAELCLMVESQRYASWRAALASVQGVYVIADARTGQLYVGKADGTQRLLGRWRDYAATGHGGNLGLREALEADPERVHSWSWSILRVFGSSEPPDAIDRAEEHFKRTLLSREFGHNRG